MLADLQRQFFHSCRTGNTASFAGLEERRLDIYRNAVFKGVKRVLEKAYPLTKVALGEDWNPLCEEFFAEYDCSSPHLWQMPHGLYEYVKAKGTDLPWLLELLYFEWIEIEVHMGPDISVAFLDDGDINIDPVVINPEHRLTRFIYPVFRDKPECLKPGNHFLFTFRHPAVLDVRFMELSPLLAVAVFALHMQPMSVVEVIKLSCEQLGLPFDNKVCKMVKEFFEDMLSRGAALGFAE